MKTYYWKETKINGLTTESYYRPIELLQHRGNTYRFAKFFGGSFTASQRQVDIWVQNGQMKVQP